MIVCPKCHFQFISTIRSNPQNKFYWGVCVFLISEHTGFSTEETHEVLKHLFLRKEVMLKEKFDAYKINITESTTQLTTGQFKRYIEEIQTWASQALGLVIPDPNQEDGICSPQ